MLLPLALPSYSQPLPCFDKLPGQTCRCKGVNAVQGSRSAAENVATADLACCCARYLLRGVVMRYLNSRFPKWAAVDAALSSEGWKLVTLLRLSPVVPWNVLNYALSVTGPLLMFSAMWS